MQRCEFNKRFLELRTQNLNKDFFVVITDYCGNKVRIKIEPTDTANGILNFYNLRTGKCVYSMKSVNLSSKKPWYIKSPSLRGFFNRPSKNFEKIFAWSVTCERSEQNVA